MQRYSNWKTAWALILKGTFDIQYRPSHDPFDIPSRWTFSLGWTFKLVGYYVSVGPPGSFDIQSRPSHDPLDIPSCWTFSLGWTFKLVGYSVSVGRSGSFDIQYHPSHDPLDIPSRWTFSLGWTFKLVGYSVSVGHSGSFDIQYHPSHDPLDIPSRWTFSLGWTFKLVGYSVSVGHSGSFDIQYRPSHDPLDIPSRWTFSPGWTFKLVGYYVSVGPPGSFNIQSRPSHDPLDIPSRWTFSLGWTFKLVGYSVSVGHSGSFDIQYRPSHDPLDIPSRWTFSLGWTFKLVGYYVLVGPAVSFDIQSRPSHDPLDIPSRWTFSLGWTFKLVEYSVSVEHSGSFDIQSRPSHDPLDIPSRWTFSLDWTFKLVGYSVSVGHSGSFDIQSHPSHHPLDIPSRWTFSLGWTFKLVGYYVLVGPAGSFDIQSRPSHDPLDIPSRYVIIGRPVHGRRGATSSGPAGLRTTCTRRAGRDVDEAWGEPLGGNDEDLRRAEAGGRHDVAPHAAEARTALERHVTPQIRPSRARPERQRRTAIRSPDAILCSAPFPSLPSCLVVPLLVSLLACLFPAASAYDNVCAAVHETPCRSNPILNEVVPPNYHGSEAPTSATGGPVQIYVSFQVMDIDDISEENMAFRIHMFVVDLWRDDRLNLSRFLDDIASSANSSADGPRRHASRVLPDEVRAALWKPDLIFVNSKNGYLFEHSVPNTFVKVLDTGHLYRYLFQVDCLMELQKYPMDTQNCYLKVGLMSTPEDTATLHWMDDPGSPQRNFSSAIRLLEDIKPLQFDLKVPVAHSATEAWMFENYTYLYANFTFVRRLTASIVNTYIPSGLVVSLSWLTFWLDVSAVPARITLGVTSILTLATQVVQSRSSLPPVDYLKAVDVWLFVCLVMVFASLLEYAVAYNFEKILALVMEPFTRGRATAWVRGAPPPPHSRPPSSGTHVDTSIASGSSAPSDGVAANNHNHALVPPSVVTLSVPNSVHRPETNNVAPPRPLKTGRRRIFQRSFTLGQLWQKTNLLGQGVAHSLPLGLLLLHADILVLLPLVNAPVRHTGCAPATLLAERGELVRGRKIDMCLHVLADLLEPVQ
ncbi:hypothetical protein MRX96_021794 [Rhipicephalus microplus]